MNLGQAAPVCVTMMWRAVCVSGKEQISETWSQDATQSASPGNRTGSIRHTAFQQIASYGNSKST